MMKEPDVMVYLMTGFLDSGKTRSQFYVVHRTTSRSTVRLF